MEILKDLGIAGFFFFLIKGLVWIVLFLLVYFGIADKKKIQRLKNRISFRQRKSDAEGLK